MLALAAAQGVALAQPPTDWERQQAERNWREAEVVLPAFPQKVNLMPFFVSAASSYEFYIDGASLAVGEDGVVRYVLVARSSLGAESVSFEGIRCSTSEYRIYATGKSGGGWLRSSSPWRRIAPRQVQRWHNALRDEFLCPFGRPIRSAAEGVDALRRGGHPSRSRSGN
ncbi:MAG: CNP1-like family protein [Betaproteobacteria bacterium]|nr:CNP1-like family protein [Betaproteobacteria bacterium]